MAIVTPKGLSGVLGPLIFFSRNGILCSRVKPAHVHNPKTPRQTNHRNKLGLSSRFIKACSKSVKTGYQATSADHCYNEARRFIYKNCFIDSADGNPQMIWENILISRGLIQKPEEFSMIPDCESVTINWKLPVKGDGTDGGDFVMVLMFSDEGKSGLALEHDKTAQRKDGTARFALLKSPKPVHAWMFFYNPLVCDGESRAKISDSVYLGMI